MHYIVNTAPTSLPLNISDVLDYLRVDGNDDINVINNLIETVTDIAQKYTNRTFINTEYVLYYDRLPDATQCDHNYIKLINGSIITVSEVKVFNNDATSQVLTDYELTHSNMNGRLYPSLVCGWVTDKILRLRNAVQITYTAGYGDTRSSMPAGLANAMMQMIGFMYENREGAEVPQSVLRGLDKFRIIEFS